MAHQIYDLLCNTQCSPGASDGKKNSNSLGLLSSLQKDSILCLGMGVMGS